MKEVYGISSLVRITLLYNPHGKLRKYKAIYQKYDKEHKPSGNIFTLAYFDTEEKGRMYCQAFDEGLSTGRNLTD